jgi:hypothetical protein
MEKMFFQMHGSQKKKTPAVISRNPTAALRFVYLFCLWVVCDFSPLFSFGIGGVWARM